MSVGMFMAVLDIQIVASSLPQIRIGLGIELDRLSWVQTAYLMAEIVSIPLTGWLTRMMSTRWAFLACVWGFTLASAGCAASSGFWTLISARVVQGLCGGALIPLVFSAVFVMFDGKDRLRATVVAGLLAMIAPTLGPTVGGFVTDRLSWHWLFLINVPPGVLVGLAVMRTVGVDRPDWRFVRSVDLVAIPLLAVFLATLEVVLKEAPHRGWGDPVILGLLAVCAGGGGSTLWRCARHPTPLVDLAAFRHRNFVFGCWFSFVLGVGLYGAGYLLPLFLGLVRGHTALAIGEIMIVAGAVQLVATPAASILERRLDARVMTAIGYVLLAVGCLSNGFATPATDFWGLFWQQAARGAALMFCVLPTTTLALESFPAPQVPNASGLFNLMRNLGGAIGLALIDTIVENRAPVHAAALTARLRAGDADAASFIELPAQYLSAMARGAMDPQTRDTLEKLIQRGGMTQAFNDAWLLIGGLIVLSLLLLPLLRPARGAAPPLPDQSSSGRKRSTAA
ncbi:MAG TPA: DHA2 family efflux MFS transporter permease subunit, partial [Stellaceae bacterium]|nr:DHA2 family efflux MFS transporter permease subunit [Stellaceae bacterium]